MAQLIQYNIYSCRQSLYVSNKSEARDLPGSTVVKNPPASAGDMGLIPGPGRSHMPWSN